MEQSLNNKKNNSNSSNSSKKNNSKDISSKNKFNNFYKNLLYFSKKILEAKHGITPELYNKIILNNLITRKRNHSLAYFNELAIITNTLKEQLKRYYTYEESKTRIPKYVSYYQNYLKFFCKPLFADYFLNKKMVKHMEKEAQVFYNENYADEEENNNLDDESRRKCNFKIFSKTINNEIDNYDNISKDYTDSNNKILEALKKNKKKKKDDSDNFLDNESMDKNKLKFRNNDLDLLENIYKITPILDIDKLKKKAKEKNKNNISYNYDEEIKNSEMDSFQKILNEISNKKKGKNKENKENKDNKDNVFKKSPLFFHNSSVFDYFNSLSIMLFSKKKKGFLNKNNSLNNKFKKKDKNNNNNYNNKIINNININIKHLTIGQKSMNPLSEINNLYNNCINKKEKRRMSKSRKHNSMILRDKSFKKYSTHFDNLTSKNMELKKRNDSFNIFQPPKAIIGYNSNFNNSNYKKISNINTNSMISNTRNKSKLKGTNFGKFNNGCTTSMNKNKKNTNNKNQIGKMTIYTNSIQNNRPPLNKNKKNYSLKNLLNLTNSSSSKITKELANKSINFNNIKSNNNLKNNLSSLALYKKSLAVISPLLYTNKYKNSNISLNKGVTPMSFERVRTTSHKSSHKNLGIINYNNFISPKNTLNNNMKNRNNAKSHTNLMSPINMENNGNKRKYNYILLKKKIKDEKGENNSKVINLKYKNYVKFNGLRKNTKNIDKRYQSYNKGKKYKTEKKK